MGVLSTACPSSALQNAVESHPSDHPHHAFHTTRNAHSENTVMQAEHSSCHMDVDGVNPMEAKALSVADLVGSDNVEAAAAAGAAAGAAAQVPPPDPAENIDIFGDVAQEDHEANEADQEPAEAAALLQGENRDLNQSADIENATLPSQSMQNGFLYDESSGTWYNADLGYYYDASQGLYGDASSGQWYAYKDGTYQLVC